MLLGAAPLLLPGFMKRSQLNITLLVLGILLVTGFANRLPVTYGAVPWTGWGALVFVTLFIVLGLVFSDAKQRRLRVKQDIAAAEVAIRESLLAEAAAFQQGTATQTPNATSTVFDPKLLDPDGPPYPHPVINVVTCIGCHACVDACPHDVLAIVNGKATPVAVEQCMEDTSCQVECPTVPKSCIVINTTKPIPERKVPQRDARFMTNVPGIYLIGDVSGVPLIKNAINEGGTVVDYVVEDIRRMGGAVPADFDVAIIGIGPAGLSATALAAQRGLKYIAIEQDQIVGTIQQTYQAGKYVYFNPVDKPTKGGIQLEGAGASKEDMISVWMQTVRANGLVINEYESCKSVKPEGNSFLVETEQEKTKSKKQYRVRRVILAIGNRGMPMKLGVSGEDLRFTVTPVVMMMPTFCNKCGEKRTGENKFCQNCGNRFVPKSKQLGPVEDEKVKYKLTDPNDYNGKHVMVVGAGNSAIEAAIDLAAYRSEDGTQIIGWRDNIVTLVIRSNFKSDLKLGNKMLVYDCIDEGKISVYFGQTIKEVTPGEVALMNARERDAKTAAETARVKNDYVFALIGGEKPTKFLESIGIKIG